MNASGREKSRAMELEGMAGGSDSEHDFMVEVGSSDDEHDGAVNASRRRDDTSGMAPVTKRGTPGVVHNRHVLYMAKFCSGTDARQFWKAMEARRNTYKAHLLSIRFTEDKAETQIKTEYAQFVDTSKLLYNKLGRNQREIGQFLRTCTKTWFAPDKVMHLEMMAEDAVHPNGTAFMNHVTQMNQDYGLIQETFENARNALWHTP